jgi:hypothetical protein
MECIIIGGWLFCGVLASSILSGRGSSGLGGFALGLLFGPIGIIIAALWPVSPKALEEKSLQVGDMIKCPHCAEPIRMEANVCRYCQRELTTSDFVKQAAAATHEGRKAEARQILLYTTRRDKSNEEAWLWLSRVAQGEQEYEKCLKSVVAVNPDNAEARERLEELAQRRAARAQATKRYAMIAGAVVAVLVAGLGFVAVAMMLWTQLTG